MSTQSSGTGPPTVAVPSGTVGSLATKAKSSLAIGFGVAVLGMILGVLTRSKGLFPYVAPGMFIGARLFGQPRYGPPELWILLGVAMNTVFFSVVVFLARLAIVMWQRRQ